ncbi:hypothetical protein VB716_01505 [Synechococcus sp. CCY9201]|uniref:hypothetical protein n=1 Tax=Synechococcus sp. CCY9201 TaxID=174697 RepID=UPI002B20DD82|nr:hypothetical protein [Synechococcus sp. CCY9201]MEA5472898.1 hypothetical protein [Synechococcus sp. CCY9201]
MKRLEQVAALVVAAGLAIVSYWLFFSWAQGGGAHRRPGGIPVSPPGSSQSRAPDAGVAMAADPLAGVTVRRAP